MKIDWKTIDNFDVGDIVLCKNNNVLYRIIEKSKSVCVLEKHNFIDYIPLLSNNKIINKNICYIGYSGWWISHLKKELYYKNFLFSSYKALLIENKTKRTKCDIYKHIKDDIEKKY